jgi:hypothetical protein
MNLKSKALNTFIAATFFILSMAAVSLSIWSIQKISTEQNFLREHGYDKTLIIYPIDKSNADGGGITQLSLLSDSVLNQIRSMPNVEGIFPVNRSFWKFDGPSGKKEKLHLFSVDPDFIDSYKIGDPRAIEGRLVFAQNKSAGSKRESNQTKQVSEVRLSLAFEGDFGLSDGTRAALDRLPGQTKEVSPETYLPLPGVSPDMSMAYSERIDSTAAGNFIPVTIFFVKLRSAINIDQQADKLQSILDTEVSNPSIRPGVESLQTLFPKSLSSMVIALIADWINEFTGAFIFFACAIAFVSRMGLMTIEIGLRRTFGLSPLSAAVRANSPVMISALLGIGLGALTAYILCNLLFDTKQIGPAPAIHVGLGAALAALIALIINYRVAINSPMTLIKGRE